MTVTIKLSSFNMVALEKSYNIFKKVHLNNKLMTIENKNFKIDSLKYVRMPNKRSIYTILKSPHIDKKARNQLGIISHNRLICLNLTETNNTDATITLNKVVASLKDVSTKIKFKNINTI